MVKRKTKAKKRVQRVLEISAKCSDLFYAQLGAEEYDGYVPGFFPGEHFGDYVQLKIDVDTGKIIDWKRPTAEQLNHMFKSESNRLIRRNQNEKLSINS